MNKTRSSLPSRLTPFASPKALALSLSTVLSLALLVALALTSLAAPAAGAGAANGAPAKVVISKVTVNDKKVTVKGKVTLPTGTAPKRAKVVLSLINNTGDIEQLSAKVNAKRKFKATKTTKLTGDLTVVAAVKIGKKTGPQARKRFAGPPASAAGPGGSTKSGGGGASTGKPLIGLFKLDPGKQAISGKITGTYFRMMGGSAGSPLPNGDSPFFDKTYTPLSPGTDGGLSTVVYQPPPSPAFAGTSNGLPTGDALANRIVLPQTFFGIKFSIATDSVGLPSTTATPVPVILNDNGKLSGQVPAWSAAWNGMYFSQGSPKPDGKLGGTWGLSGTTPLTGTYDAATGHYQISWQSLIEGGPFDGYSGQWFLEGTFVPAS